MSKRYSCWIKLTTESHPLIGAIKRLDTLCDNLPDAKEAALDVGTEQDDYPSGDRVDSASSSLPVSSSSSVPLTELHVTTSPEPSQSATQQSLSSTQSPYLLIPPAARAVAVALGLSPFTGIAMNQRSSWLHVLQYCWMALVILSMILRALRNLFDSVRDSEATADADVKGLGVSWLAFLWCYVWHIFWVAKGPRSLLCQTAEFTYRFPTRLMELVPQREEVIRREAEATITRAFQELRFAIFVGVVMALVLNTSAGHFTALQTGSCGDGCTSNLDDSLWDVFGRAYILWFLLVDLVVLSGILVLMCLPSIAVRVVEAHMLQLQNDIFHLISSDSPSGAKTHDTQSIDSTGRTLSHTRVRNAAMLLKDSVNFLLRLRETQMVVSLSWFMWMSFLLALWLWAAVDTDGASPGAVLFVFPAVSSVLMLLSLSPAMKLLQAIERSLSLLETADNRECSLVVQEYVPVSRICSTWMIGAIGLVLVSIPPACQLLFYKEYFARPVSSCPQGVIESSGSDVFPGLAIQFCSNERKAWSYVYVTLYFSVAFTLVVGCFTWSVADLNKRLLFGVFVGSALTCALDLTLNDAGNFYVRLFAVLVALCYAFSWRQPLEQAGFFIRTRGQQLCAALVLIVALHPWFFAEVVNELVADAFNDDNETFLVLLLTVFLPSMRLVWSYIARRAAQGMRHSYLVPYHFEILYGAFMRLALFKVEQISTQIVVVIIYALVECGRHIAFHVAIYWARMIVNKGDVKRAWDSTEQWVADAEQTRFIMSSNIAEFQSIILAVFLILAEYFTTSTDTIVSLNDILLVAGIQFVGELFADVLSVSFLQRQQGRNAFAEQVSLTSLSSVVLFLIPVMMTLAAPTPEPFMIQAKFIVSGTTGTMSDGSMSPPSSGPSPGPPPGPMPP